MDTRKMVTAEEARRVMDDITPTEWDASPVGQSERRAEDRRLAARLTEISTWHEARRWVGTVVALHEDVRRFAALLAAATTERDEARAEVRRLTAALDAARREGAEGMRWEASEAAEQWLREVAEVTEDSPADLADAIRALPLDGDGGAT